jgi:5'-3' exonuclease
VIESFRNRLWRSYKTSAGVPADLLEQFQLLEDTMVALGVRVWPMIEYEADDALAAAAARAADDERVDKVFICTPDKDLAQSVRGTRVVQLIRRTNVELDEPAVQKKFGVLPESIPDYLSLVGDSADGYPGLPGWGAKSSAAVLAKFHKLEQIPADWREWRVNANNAASLSATFDRDRDLAFLFRDLATLRTDIPVFDTVDQLEWKGPTERFAAFAAKLDAATTEKR